MQDRPVGTAQMSPPAKRIGVVVIHGVGEADTGWTNTYIANELTARSDIAFVEHSELYTLPDRGQRREGTFPALVRRAAFGGNAIAFAELCWADLSKAGRGPFTQMLAVLKVFFEAPDVMASAMLRQSRRGIHRVLRFLIQLAIWIFKWPIVGLNVTAFACGLVLAGVEWLYPGGIAGFGAALGIPNFAIEAVVFPVLLILAAAGLFIARRRVHKDIWLTDLSFSTAAASFVVANAIVFNMKFELVAVNTLADWFQRSLQVIFWVWTGWSAVVIAAFAVMLVITGRRAIFGRSQNEPPLHRPAAALWLTLLQAVGWNLVIPAAGLLLSLALVSCPGGDCALRADRERMLGALWFGLLGLIVVALFLTALFAGRRHTARLYRDDLGQAAARMDRLIISPVLLVTAFIAMAFDIITTLAGLKPRLLADDLLNATSAIMVAFLVIWLYTLNKLSDASDGILHIARDLIDHQYTPKFGVMKWLLPRKKRRRALRPRRARIHERLAVVIERLIAQEHVDKLVFLTHSQGSVIMYDYLREREPEPVLDRIGEIHVLTVGSPLSHLYQYYFEEYGRDQPAPGELRGTVKSWTNMWRVDDPIGDRVDIVEGGFIRNIPLPAGGHRDYWRDDAVSSAILALIEVTEKPRDEGANASKRGGFLRGGFALPARATAARQ